MPISPPPVNDLVRACDLAEQWLGKATQESIHDDVRRGILDAQLFASSGYGFTWAAALPQRPQALAWALKAGWLADKPCVFKSSVHSGRALWLPFDALACELTPFCVGAERGARCIESFGAAGVRMLASNPMGETSLHAVARNESAWSATMAILAHDQRIDIEDAKGQTALRVARGEQNIFFLLAAGANLDACDIRGARAIDAALARPEGPAAWARYERSQLRCIAQVERGERASRL